jgi:peptidoglycan/LPS O-acetylase OafA/YrhL
MMAGCYRSQEVSGIANSGIWIGEDSVPPHTFFRLLQCLTYKTMLLGDNVFDTSLWTISTELYGSFFVFGFLALAHNTRNRAAMLLLCLVYCFFMKMILASFILGINLNYIDHVKINRNKYVVSGFAVILLLASLVLGSFPTTTEIRGTLFENMPAWLFVYNFWFHIIGAFLLVLAFVLSPAFQFVISLRLFRFLGYISFSLYLLHPVIIFTFSCALFLGVYGHLGYNSSVALVLVCTILVAMPLAWLMTKYIDGPGIRLAKYCYARWGKPKPPLTNVDQIV